MTIPKLQMVDTETGLVTLANVFNRVLFPLPLGPMIAWIFPLLAAPHKDFKIVTLSFLFISLEAVIIFQNYCIRWSQFAILKHDWKINFACRWAKTIIAMKLMEVIVILLELIKIFGILRFYYDMIDFLTCWSGYLSGKWIAFSFFNCIVVLYHSYHQSLFMVRLNW